MFPPRPRHRVTLTRPDPIRLRHAALSLAARGWRVFPLCPHTKTPALHGHRACPGTGECATEHHGWQHRATHDPTRIHAWWDNTTPYNIAIATGPSNLVVLDLDTAHDAPPRHWTGVCHGRDVLAHLAHQAGRPYPGATYTVRTPTGGRHLYFQAPTTAPKLRNTTGRIGWHIDSRANGGYIVAAESVLPHGRYETLLNRPVAPLPHWLLPLLTPKPRNPARQAVSAKRRVPDSRTRAYLQTVTSGVAHAPYGTRHDTLRRAACTLGRLVAGGEITHDRARHTLRTAAAGHLGIHGWTTAETERTINDGLTFGTRHPRQLDPPPSP